MKPRLAAFILLFCILLNSCSNAGTALPPTLPNTASPTVLSPTLAPTLAPTATALATFTPQKPRQSIVVMSWDGAGADMIYAMMAEGLMPTFANLASQGVRAEYALSVDPPMTAVAQNSIATGAYPSQTGITSNSFHNPNDAIYWYRRGFDELLDQAEPVWVTASDAGYKTAALFFAAGTPMLPGQTADYTIGYGIRDAYSKQEIVPLAPISETWQGDLPASYSPPLEGSFALSTVARVYLYVVDSTDDQTANYDTVLLSVSRAVDSKTPNLQTGQWGQLILLPRLVSGADFLIQKISQDQAPAQVTLFYSNVFHNAASPREFLNGVNEKFGFFPAGSDSYALEHGWITPEDDMYLMQRAARWSAEVTAWVIQTYHPDLVFSYHDVIDGAGHSFLMQDERQYNYTPEKAQQYQEYYRRALQMADQGMQTIINSIDLKTTTLMVVADHGMAPIHTVVYVNKLLEDAGLLVLDKQNYVVVSKSKAVAFCSGGSVHVYINLKGHEKSGGFVTQDEYPIIQAQIVEMLQSLTDPNTGEMVFQRVLRQDELGSLHLDHLNSGDVFAQAFPGYQLDHYRGTGVVFEPAIFYGQHGYDSTIPSMHPIFIAAGAGVPQTGQVIPPVQIIDIAPTIAYLFGFTPHPTVAGQIIPILTGNP
jgi:predicted AlkP superfamily phosphohydrolase/phosphomutase